MNTNKIHNILNLIGLLVGALLAFDWQSLGFSAATAVTLAGWFIVADKVIKLAMNVTRDGIAGLWMRQPPVER